MKKAHVQKTKRATKSTPKKYQEAENSRKQSMPSSWQYLFTHLINLQSLLEANLQNL